tara:strand:+ start:230 stop:850 length:621 start_codon:yes stop_codon:yes gene_type:complete
MLTTKNTTIVNDCFTWVKDKVLPGDFCKHIIEKFENNIHLAEQGETGNGLDLNTKKSLDLCISRWEDWKEENKYMQDSLRSCVAEYQNFTQQTKRKSFVTGENYHFAPPYKMYKDTGFQIQKTEAGEGFTWHSDGYAGRVLTYIFYLNTVDEGWTQFHNGDQIAPETGKVLIFPADWTYFHQGYPPKQTKYIMTGWLVNYDNSFDL